MEAVLLRVHFFPGLCLLILGLGLQFPVVRWLLDSYRRRRFDLAGRGCFHGSARWLAI